MDKTCTNLLQIQIDCEALSAKRITKKLNQFEIAVAREGSDGFIVIVPNLTHKGLAHVLARFLHGHRLEMAVEGERSAQ